MSPPRSHHFLILVLLATVGAMLLFGTSRAFAPVHAGQSPTKTLQPQATAGTSSQVPDATPTPTATPGPSYPHTDTSGIIALSIALVAIIVFGVLWGGGGRRKNPNPKKK